MYKYGWPNWKIKISELQKGANNRQAHLGQRFVAQQF
jgi:hypothetical protein